MKSKKYPKWSPPYVPRSYSNDSPFYFREGKSDPGRAAYPDPEKRDGAKEFAVCQMGGGMI